MAETKTQSASRCGCRLTVTALTALARAVAHQPRAVILLATIVVLQAALNLSTRYAGGG